MSRLAAAVLALGLLSRSAAGATDVPAPFTQPTPMPSPTPRLAPAIAVYFSGPALDLATTEYGLARGMREGHPLMQHRAARFGWRLATASALAAYDRRELRRGRNPKRLRIAWLATNAVIVGWNVHKLATRQR
jgi:hypothetical protein